MITSILVENKHYITPSLEILESIERIENHTKELGLTVPRIIF